MPSVAVATAKVARKRPRWFESSPFPPPSYDN